MKFQRKMFREWKDIISEVKNATNSGTLQGDLIGYSEEGDICICIWLDGGNVWIHARYVFHRTLPRVHGMKGM